MTERSFEATLRTTLADADALPRPSTVNRAAGVTVDELAVAAAAGDVESVGRLYDALLDPIYRYVAVRVRHREDAQDLTQLVFERIVTALPRYRHQGRPFAAWAYRIARNAVIDHQRQRRPTTQLGSIAEPSADIALEDQSLRGEEIRELRAAIGRLTPDQQEAIVLRYAIGLSAEEAAAVMGRRAGTIRGLTFRAIESLRRHFAEAEVGESLHAAGSVCRDRSGRRG